MWFSLTFPVCSKFPDFSLTGKCLPIFPGFPGFPVQVGTLINRKFRIAASQVLFVDNQIKDTEIRFYRTQNESKRRMSFFYMLRLRLCTLENIRNRFYDYAVLQADELESLQLEFMELTGLHEWDDDLLQDADLAHHIVDIDFDEDIDDDEIFQ